MHSSGTGGGWLAAQICLRPLHCKEKRQPRRAERFIGQQMPFLIKNYLLAQNNGEKLIYTKIFLPFDSFTRHENSLFWGTCNTLIQLYFCSATHQPLSHRNLLPVSTLLSVSYPTPYLLEHITEQMCKDLIWETHEQVRRFNPEVPSPAFPLHPQNRGNCIEILIPLTYPFL